MRIHGFLLSLLICSTVQPSLSLAQPGGPVVFMGTEVSPLGGATLSIGAALAASTPQAAPQSNRLYVGNLSFSGNDGMRMHIGGGSGAIVRSNDIAATLPLGGEIVFHVSNGLGINPCCIVGRTGAVMFQTTPEFGPVSDYEIVVYSTGTPVTQYSNLSGPITTSMAPVEFSVSVLATTPLPDPYLLLPAVEPFPVSEGFSLRWAAAVSVMDASGATLGTGDEVTFFPTSSLGLGSVDHVDVTVSVPAGLPAGTLGVDDLAQEIGGHTYRDRKNGSIVAADFGKATMTLAPGIPGSIQVDMDESEIEECLIWDIKDSDGASAGDTDEFSVTGDLITGGQGEVGKVMATCDGSQWTVTPDFSGSGSPDAYVELLDDSGNVLGINPCTIDPLVVMTNAWASETGVEDNNNLALVLGFPTPVPIDLPGVGLITASKIKMEPNAAKRYRYFVIVDRTSANAMGGDYGVERAPNAFRIDHSLTMAEFFCHGIATGKRTHGPLLIHGMGASGNDGAIIVPCVMPGESPPDQFGVQWAPLGPPSARMGETDWAFVSRLAGDPEPVSRMSLHLGSDGSTVGVTVDPAQSSTTEYQVILKKDGAVVAEFTHSDSGTPIVDLADWPIGIGYQLLQAPDQPWSMWIDLGYDMDVTTPAGPASKHGAAAFPLTKADLIEVIAKNTSNPGPPEETALDAHFTDIPYIVMSDRSPAPTRVGPAPPTARSVLHPAFPNPFNPRTMLAFDLATTGYVSLEIYAVDGRRVATVHEGVLRAGPHAYEWNGVNRRGQPVASGVYLAELRTPDGARRTKLNLLK